MEERVEVRQRCFLVITTISEPTAILRELVDGSVLAGWRTIIVGDVASPPGFSMEGAEFLSIEDQAATDFEVAELLPTRHYCRKNLGYLRSIEEGADVIVETDDDNRPLELFWHAREYSLAGRHPLDAGWVNAYSAFSAEHVWPRGLPLDSVLSPASAVTADAPPGGCPVQQALVNGDPDVDAVYRLTVAQNVEFRKEQPLLLHDGQWCPFNSQNTTWWPAAWPLLYLPATCTFRMTDIWRSLVAQAWLLGRGLHVAFTAPSMRQERNVHDLMRDFGDEIPGYLHNSAIVAALETIGAEMPAGDFLLRAYEKLVSMGLVDRTELEIVRAWCRDVDRVMDRGPNATQRGTACSTVDAQRPSGEGDDDRR